MARRHLEDRVDDLEKTISALRVKHDRTLPNGIDARLVRLEEIAEALFKLIGNSIVREQAQVKLELNELGHKKVAFKRRRSLKKAKPVKRKRAVAS